MARLGTSSVRFAGVAVFNWFAAVFVLMLVTGCASTADRRPVVTGPTSVLPAANPGSTATEGSLFSEAGAPTVSRFVPLFANVRARLVGDIVTVQLNERTSANRSSNASAEKSSGFGIEADFAGLENLGGVTSRGTRLGQRGAALGTTLDGLSADGSVNFEGEGSASAQNVFTGTISATVIEVLANGNLVIAGEKQIAVSNDEEVIRISGVVNPADLVNDTVNSTRLADLRLEYRGRGVSDDVQTPGWLSRLLFKASPF